MITRPLRPLDDLGVELHNYTSVDIMNEWLDSDDDDDGSNGITLAAAERVMPEEPAQRRRAEEEALFERIREAVPRAVFLKLTLAVDELRFQVLSPSDFHAHSQNILRRHAPLCSELHALTRPGTDIYIFTEPDEPLLLRPYFKLDNLALDWDVQGDLFSDKCGFCFGHFDAAIRTLPCKHSYCASCLIKYLKHKNIIQDDAFEGEVELECPICKDKCRIAAAPTGLDEKAHNSLLLTLLAKTLKYKCPFEGCDGAFVRQELECHVEVCPHRKYMCNMGCDTVVVKSNLHERPGDCISFLRNSKDKAEADNRGKDRRMNDMENEIKKLKEALNAAIAASGNRTASSSSSSAAATSSSGQVGRKRARSVGAA